MRIALLIEQFPAAPETFILNQVLGLSALGHEVTVIARRPGDDDQASWAVLPASATTLTAYRPVLQPGAGARLLQAPGLLTQALLRSPSQALRALDVRRYGRHGLSLQLLAHGLPIMDAPRFDVLHGHFGPQGVFAAKLAHLRAMGEPVACTFYGYDLTTHDPHAERQLQRWMIDTGALLLPICRPFRDKLRALGASDAHMHIHHLGVDPDLFTFKPRTPEQGGPLRLLTIARAVEKKGVEVAMRALSLARAGGLDVRYTIVGGGPRFEDWKRLAGELDLDDLVHFAGWLPPEGVRQQLDRAHVLVVPSVTAASGDQEGTPTVILEAMASGLPVVATMHSGIPEQVLDGETGILVPERDAGALADAFRRIASEGERWPEMGRAGRAHVEAQFDVSRLNLQLQAHYRALGSAR